MGDGNWKEKRNNKRYNKKILANYYFHFRILSFLLPFLYSKIFIAPRLWHGPPFLPAFSWIPLISLLVPIYVLPLLRLFLFFFRHFLLQSFLFWSCIRNCFILFHAFWPKTGAMNWNGLKYLCQLNLGYSFLFSFLFLSICVFPPHLHMIILFLFLV